jgi:hypothetical protein
VTIKREKHLQVEEFQLPSGYDYITVCHGKIHHFLKGKPSISMGHLYHGYVSHKLHDLSLMIMANHGKNPLFLWMVFWGKSSRNWGSVHCHDGICTFCFFFFIGDSLENQSPWNFQLTSRYQVVNHGLQFTWAPAGL